MKNKTIVFYDFEASGISRDADPISLGLLAVTETVDIKDLHKKTLSEEEAIEIIKTITKEEFDLSDLYDNTESKALRFIVNNEYDDLYDNLLSTKKEIKERENWGFHTFVTNTYLIDVDTEVEITVSYYDHPAHGNMNEEYVLKSIKKITKQTDIKSFYSEFTDYNIEKADDWVRENIIGKLQLDYLKPNLKQDIPINGVDDVTDVNNIKLLGTTFYISKQVKEWLAQFEDPCFIADFSIIDAPMLIDLIADWDYNTIQHWGESSPPVVLGERKYKIGLPKHLPNIRYDQFFDLHTIFWMKGIDTDINREEFVGFDNGFPVDNFILENTGQKHNSLWDSYVTWKCYEKLMKI